MNNDELIETQELEYDGEYFECHRCKKKLKINEVYYFGREPYGKCWCKKHWDEVLIWIKEKKKKEERDWFTITLLDLEKRYAEVKIGTKEYEQFKKDLRKYGRELKFFKQKNEVKTLND